MSMTVTVKSPQGTGLRRMNMRGFFLNSCGTTVPYQKNAARVKFGGGVPDLAQPSRTALRLGAIHKRSSVPNLMYVLNSLYCLSLPYETSSVRSRIL